MSEKTDSYHHGNLRESLLDAAIAILTTEGASGIKMRSIGKVVGVSASAAYRHFSDKQALLAAIAQRGFDELARHLDEVFNNEDLSSGDRLATIGHQYIRFAIENKAQYRLMYGTDAVRQDNYPELAKSERNMERIVFRAVKLCQADGIMRGTKPSEIVSTIWSTSHGAAMLVIDGFIKTDDIDAFAERIIDHVRYGISRSIE